MLIRTITVRLRASEDIENAVAMLAEAEGVEIIEITEEREPTRSEAEAPVLD